MIKYIVINTNDNTVIDEFTEYHLARHRMDKLIQLDKDNKNLFSYDAYKYQLVIQIENKN